jgi:hypothetical protein
LSKEGKKLLLKEDWDELYTRAENDPDDIIFNMNVNIE